jgi:hypothetical protein
VIDFPSGREGFPGKRGPDTWGLYLICKGSLSAKKELRKDVQTFPPVVESQKKNSLLFVSRERIKNANEEVAHRRKVKT